MPAPQSPSESARRRMRAYVEKYRARSGTSAHPEASVTDGVIEGLARNIDETGRPLCPCNFYPDRDAEVKSSRRWLCACDEMKQFKYCHCLLFVTSDGKPITEYLPPDHEGRAIYGVVADPTPDKGREASRH